MSGRGSPPAKIRKGGGAAPLTIFPIASLSRILDFSSATLVWRKIGTSFSLAATNSEFYLLAPFRFINFTTKKEHAITTKTAIKTVFIKFKFSIL